MNTTELREMSDEQLADTLKDSYQTYFRLKIASANGAIGTRQVNCVAIAA